MEKSKSTKIILATLVTLVIAAIGFYFLLPAINPYSQEFWIYLLALILIWGAAYLVIGGGFKNVFVMNSREKKKKGVIVRSLRLLSRSGCLAKKALL